MNTYQIFSVTIGILMVAHCFIYSANRPKGFENIKEMMLFGAISIAITLMALAHPEWWTVGILMYLLILFRKILCNRRLCDLGHYGYCLNPFRKTLKIILSWVTIIIIILISIKMVSISEGWGEIIVFFPVAVITCMGLALQIKERLDSSY